MKIIYTLLYAFFSLSLAVTGFGCASSLNRPGYTQDIRLAHNIIKTPSLLSIAFSPDGQFLAKGIHSSIYLIESSSGKTIRKIGPGGQNIIISLAFSPDGRYLAAGSYRKIMIWDTAQYKWIRVINSHKDYVTSLAFNPDGDILASGSKGIDRNIKFWDTDKWRLIRSLDMSKGYKYANYIHDIAFSPDGRYFASAGLNRVIRIWDVMSGRMVKEIENRAIITSLAFGKDSEILAAGGMDSAITLWNAVDGEKIDTIKRHTGPITSVRFSRDGEYMAAASLDRTIKVWDAAGEGYSYKQGIEINEDGGNIAFSPDLLSAASLNRNGDTSFYRLLMPEEKKNGIPPVISILTPQDNATVQAKKVRLSGKAADDTGIKKISFTVNNITLHKYTRDLTIGSNHGKAERFDLDISLKEGENSIIVSAVDLDDLTSHETITVNHVPRKGEIWGAVIGISRYKNVRNLKYADKDAEDFYEYLAENNGIPEDHLFKLLNEEATNKNVRDLLGVKLKKLAGRNDTVIIFYAGHGAAEPDSTSPDGDGLEKYLLPYNADPDSLYSTALPMEDISKILGWIKAGRVAFISDTCYSGAGRFRSGRTILASRRTRAISGSFLNRISRGKGRVILTASEANEVSIEDDALEHGIFTYYLLEALEGAGDRDNNGLITVDEAYSYVTEKVPDATGQNQHPVKKGDVTGEIIIGRIK